MAAAPATTSLLSALLQLPLAPFSGRRSPPPPSVVHVAPPRSPTAAVAATKGYNVQIVVDENEGEESIFRRFRREVMRAGVLQEIKRRRRYESKKDERKRKARGLTTSRLAETMEGVASARVGTRKVAGEHSPLPFSLNYLY